MKPKKLQPRFIWTAANVTTHNVPRMIMRTYYEWQALADIVEPLNLQSACEVGCGFGRMTTVLADYATEVYGIEREPALVESARMILPQVEIMQVNNLFELPLEENEVEFAMTFTVLQHMSGWDAARVTEEMKRISSRYILLVEDTDPEHHYVDAKNSLHFTHGRSVDWYAGLVEPFELVLSEERLVEPSFTYKGQRRETVGHFMLFERGP